VLLMMVLMLTAMMLLLPQPQKMARLQRLADVSLENRSNTKM
jgi:hypothetical protein